VQVVVGRIGVDGPVDPLADGRSRRVVHAHVLPARGAVVGIPAEPLHPDTIERLARRGVSTLWSHQAEAVDLLRSGRHVVVATSTASGKSLCYQLPIVDDALSGRRDTALVLAPTKALARDQLAALADWDVPDLVCAA